MSARGAMLRLSAFYVIAVVLVMRALVPILFLEVFFCILFLLVTRAGGGAQPGGFRYYEASSFALMS
jgi:hypothetical protein